MGSLNYPEEIHSSGSDPASSDDNSLIARLVSSAAGPSSSSLCYDGGDSFYDGPATDIIHIEDYVEDSTSALVPNKASPTSSEPNKGVALGWLILWCPIPVKPFSLSCLMPPHPWSSKDVDPAGSSEGATLFVGMNAKVLSSTALDALGEEVLPRSSTDWRRSVQHGKLRQKLSHLKVHAKKAEGEAKSALKETSRLKLHLAPAQEEVACSELLA
ncbi:hypothetical protein Acr_11g0011090 [Actinidia rufa]|uniref:Uncharacterized protein n=1 Tax=Actinidia rufa TaxID=165716 RepID=A0A7J0FDY8_9ERIC|nr:hypothetical protein Acr_11g0011090 [Actinidia rufa]